MSIIKTYKANTNISINVVLPSKKNLHIAFTPLSNGNSVFTTDNEEVQKSIESHYKFGKLFKLYATQGHSSTKKPTVVKLPKESFTKEQPGENIDTCGEDTKLTHETQDSVENTTVELSKEQPGESIDTCGENTESTHETQDSVENEDVILRKVKVSDIASAKDYLADTFGISRTILRSTKSIKEHAKEHGIEFEGL